MVLALAYLAGYVHRDYIQPVVTTCYCHFTVPDDLPMLPHKI